MPETFCLTVTSTVALTPLDETVIVAVPGLIAVMVPSPETVATLELLV